MTVYRPGDDGYDATLNTHDLFPDDPRRTPPVTSQLPRAEIPERAILSAPPLDYPKGVRGVFLGRLIGQCNDWDIVAIPAQTDEPPCDPLVQVVG